MPKTSSSAGGRGSGRSSKGAAGKKTAAAGKKASGAKKSTSAAGKTSSPAAKRGTAAARKTRTAATAKKATAAGKPVKKKSTVKSTAAKKSPARKGSGAKKAGKSAAAKAKRTPAKKSTKPAARKSTKKTAARSTAKSTAKSAASRKAAVKRTVKRAAGKTAKTKTGTRKKTAAKKAAGKTVKTTAGKTAKKATRKPAARSVRKHGVLKKVAKALGRPKKKKKAAGLDSLQKVLVAHGVEKKAPAVRAPFPAYRGTMPYIFVSYSHADMKEVFRIIKQLNASRYRIWFDEGIEPGNEWPEVVGRAVLGSSQIIVFMSPTAVESRNVRNEINLATSADKNIIVIYLKSTPLTEGLLLQIGTVQYYNKFEMADKEFIDKLKHVLSNDLHN
jgi:hypothetical protein